MRLLIIGGSGKTGRELIKQSLEEGHIVTAILRKPQKLNIKHPNLKLIQGDVLDPSSISSVFKHQEAVLSVLGHKKFIIPSNILSKGTSNIIEAMKQGNIKRLICVTALGINDSKYKLGLYYTLFTIPFILYFYFKDKEKQEDMITASDLDWTIVRPGHFIFGRKTESYRHGHNLGHVILTKMISRADVAHFMLKELKENKYIHQKPGITY